MTNNIETQVATLSKQAKIIAEQGNIVEAIQLYKEGAEALVKEKRLADLVGVLGNLAKVDENNTKEYLAQAAWITLAMGMPFQGLVTLFVALFRVLPAESNLIPLMGTTIIYSCSEYEEDRPELEKYRDVGMSILQAAGSTQGIEETESFRSWFSDRQLDDPEFFLPELMEELEAAVGDTWFFDRTILNK